MKKTVFELNIDHVIDIITNSSSELFVLEGKSKDIVKDMIISLYPDYLTEYDELKSIDELTTSELDTYISYKYDIDYTYRKTNSKYENLFGIDPNILWQNYSNKENEKYWYHTLSEVGAIEIKKKLKEQGNLFFLFSIDENPKWDYQEKLQQIAIRYHLG